MSTPAGNRTIPPIGIVGTYPPTPCGIATFSASLVSAVRTISPERGLRVVRLVDKPEPEGSSPTDVVAQVVSGSAPSRAAAAASLAGCSAVILQHEYGIYGGPDGDEVVDLVNRLDTPVIPVLHTLLPDPRPHQREVMDAILAASQQVVVMSRTAAAILAHVHGINPTRIVIIPHGGAEPTGQLRPRRHALRRPTVLTWGLIGPGKGIERALEAVALLQDLEPRYLVVGRTHPKVLEHQGEAYREALVARARELGIQEIVEFDERYHDHGALQAVLAQADVVVLPYDTHDQVTSGVLADALAAGLPVVATDFPHAREALAPGAGIVVAHDDVTAMAAALRQILTDEDLAEGMQVAATIVARDTAWTGVAASYLYLLDGLVGRTDRAAVA